VGIILGVAAVILAFAFTRRPGGDTSTAMGFSTSTSMGSTPPGPLPDFVKKVIEQPRASKDDLLRASKMAGDAGYPNLAAALLTRSSSAAQLIESPWKDVTSAAWTRFCRAISEGNEPTSVSPRGLFGLFQLSVRRLVDLGVMKDPRSRDVKLPDGKTMRVWQGVWVLPKDKFLGSPALQYRYFTKSLELYRNVVAEKYKQVIGLAIEGEEPATLSGLLAIAHMSGTSGMHRWLTDRSIRGKYTFVTNAYNKANGIF
jgi:hypothetical protein